MAMVAVVTVQRGPLFKALKVLRVQQRSPLYDPKEESPTPRNCMAPFVWPLLTALKSKVASTLRNSAPFYEVAGNVAVKKCSHPILLKHDACARLVEN